MSIKKVLLLGSILAIGASLLSSAPAGAAPAPARPAAAPAGPVSAETDRSTVAPSQRDAVLPAGWRSSKDLAWTTDGDSSGLHLLVADAGSGYTWRTAATLSEPWVSADRWVGNACLTGSGRRAVVVYAPRHFTNRSYLFDRGAFAAVVDLATGAVTKLDVTVSLAYYNPGCGTGETAVLTQSGVVDLGRTRLNVVDTTRGVVTRSHELAGEITSSVPVGDTIVAASGTRLVEINAAGKTRQLASAGSVPYRIHPDAGGGIVFTERAQSTGIVRRLAGTSVQELARGPLTGIRAVAGIAGRVFLTGTPTRVGPLPAAVTMLTSPVDAEVSSTGAVSITHTDQMTAAPAPDPNVARQIRLRANVLGTGKAVDFTVQPAGRITPAAAQGAAITPAVGRAATTPRRAGTPAPGGAGINAESPTDPVDQDRTCAVQRNDVRLQVYQPHWSQVEWAANLAVQGALNISRPANWKQSGVSAAWTPQGMFPSMPLAGGGRVPAQIMLGVLAQESNLWQASFHAAEGVTGNPLIGNYYGLRDGWGINWAATDCGYGVAQITDGMKRSGTAAATDKQRATAVDYATNIAAGVRILQDKWNQTYNMGMRVVGANPARMEAWFAALWAYNSGINPQASTGNTSGCTPSPTCTDADGNWGLGWTNNPARPDFPPDRGPFLDHDAYDNAKNPQWWPYPEKVIGWAAYPIVKYTGGNGYEAGYQQAWWPTEETRSGAKPDTDVFCVNNATTGNRCNPDNIGQGPNPCTRSDFHCWWHSVPDWGKDCSATRDNPPCGHEADHITAPGTPEPPDADAPGAYTDESRSRYLPNCGTGGLPSGALVIDDLADNVPIVRSNCGRNWTNQGTFQLTFAQHTDGLYHSKVDFHQVGMGFGGHMWFGHTYQPGDEASKHRQVIGSWTLNRTVTGWARVLVHLPDAGAHTQQAPYTISLGNGQAKTRVLLQKVKSNKWVSLGAFQFAGTPKVSLTNITPKADGSEDVAYDAVAFQLLPGKPAEQMVVLGDSFASGDGAASNADADYYPESNDGGTNGAAYRNGCHRSKFAWSRQANLPGTTEGVGSRADRFDPTMDYQMLACSGAQTENLLPAGSGVTNAFGEGGTGQHRELSQLDRGYLDENTSRVMLTIGGNDAHFADVMKICTSGTPGPLEDCRHSFTSWNPIATLEQEVPPLIDGPVKQSVNTVLGQIHGKAANAQIVLMGYPRLFPNPREWWSDCALIGLYSFEMEWLNHMADKLNWALHDLAITLTMGGWNVLYSDPRDEFLGDNACTRGEANNETVHRVVLGKTAGEDQSGSVSQQSFHPKISGQNRYAQALVSTLATLRQGTGMPTPINKTNAANELYYMHMTYSRGSSSGYQRTLFQHWVNSVPGCTTREAVLRRDNTTIGGNCASTVGTWFSPYDNTNHTSPTTLQIDHVVSLKEAWVSGADQWTAELRRTFANDLDTTQLISVSVSSNTSKGERPPDVWLPATTYLCLYARSWIETKAMYRLAVTDSEYDTLNEILNTRC
ncbi:MAG TPA: DUF1524 domain-containing protein [Mycobacteriales bacterium]|nr:DUF1524 domain-containing protein [Mycobacteriales bacterium]